MCPARVHWHVKLNYKAYWRVKITITNFNYRVNYTQWNLVVQHPNFDNLTQIFSFNYKSLAPYAGFSKFDYFPKGGKRVGLACHLFAENRLNFPLQTIPQCCGG